jgi:hypothetical protein
MPRNLATTGDTEATEVNPKGFFLGVLGALRGGELILPRALMKPEVGFGAGVWAAVRCAAFSLR